MYSRLVPAVAGLVLFPSAALAQSCEQVIALSRVSDAVVMGNDELEQHAASFCSEYNSNSGSSGSANFGASYSALSASFGSSRVSTQQIASRYCSASNSNIRNIAAYERYVESIAPGAYQAYQECINFSDVKFDINPVSIVDKSMSLPVSFTPSSEGATRATIRWEASDGIRCTWNSQRRRETRLNGPSAAILRCARSNAGRAGYVQVVRVDGSRDSFAFPWRAYDAEGIPVSRLADLSEGMAALTAAVRSMEDQPSLKVQSGKVDITKDGTRALTDTSQCPAGQGGLRGVLTKRVNFEEAFSEAPAVHFGVSRFDLRGSNGGDTNRLDISVQSVDATGFNYRFVTWCKTFVASARADWIAVGK